jgi:hypothetical protein
MGGSIIRANGPWLGQVADNAIRSLLLIRTQWAQVWKGGGSKLNLVSL